MSLTNSLSLVLYFTENFKVRWNFPEADFICLIFNLLRRGGQTHVQKICCKFCIILKAVWQHKIDIKNFLRVEMSQIEGKLV